MDKKREILLVLTILFLFNLVQATYTIDISGLKTEMYSIGDELRFTTIVLDGTEKVRDTVEIEIYDLKKTKRLKDFAQANTEYAIRLAEGFPSGIWKIKITYKNESFEQSFIIKENTKVEFDIVGDKLIIKNVGNVRYQKTIEIKIGDKTQSKTLNIPIGETKEWKLIAPEGTYDIEVTDGETTISRKNIKLFGTGNVVGAIDEGLVGYSGFGTTPIESIEDKFISLNKLPIAIVFVVLVFGLGILIGIERATRKR